MQRRLVVSFYTLILILLAFVLLFGAGRAGVDGCLDCWGGVTGFWRLPLALAGLGILAWFLKVADLVVGLPLSAEGRFFGALVVFPVVLADFSAPIPGLEGLALLGIGLAILLDRRGHAGLSAVVFAMAVAFRLQLFIFPLWIWISRIPLRRRQGKTASLVIGLGLLVGAFYLGLRPLADGHAGSGWTLKQQVFSLLGASAGGGEAGSWVVFVLLAAIVSAAVFLGARRLSPGPSEGLQVREVAGLCFLALLSDPFDGLSGAVLLLPLCMISYQSGRESCSASLRSFSRLACSVAVALSWLSLYDWLPWFPELPWIERCSLLLLASLLLMIAPLHGRSHPEVGDDPGCAA